jgi:hypothetical protein
MEFLRKILRKKIFWIKIYYFMNKIRYDIFHLEKYTIKKNYKKTFGNRLNLNNPRTLNEKIQWLKLNKKNSFYTLYADKYKVRNYFAKKFGKRGLIPLIYKTTNWRDIKSKNIPDYPCIIKGNHGSGMHKIIRNKKEVNWKKLQQECRTWMNKNYYYRSLEWQYKNIKPFILVEKLILDKNNKIPNDYKFNFFNGNLEFIYCSIDREGKNYRKIYNSDWEPLNFSWSNKKERITTSINPEIKKPKNFKKMIKIGKEISKKIELVRIDFYEVDGKLYYGEITLYHGGGFNLFEPKKYDQIYGDKLKLNKKDKIE